MKNIFDKDEISKLWPFINCFIRVALICSAVILLSTLKIIGSGEASSNENILVAFIFAFMAIIIGFCIIVKRESKVIRKYINKLNRNKNAEEIDLIFNVNNKFKFIKEAELVIAGSPDKSYALIHYDINKFTIINNSVGYKAGDEILQQMARCLRRNLKDEIIGKAEGDNFLVLFEYESQNQLINRVCYISGEIEKLKIWEKHNINPAVKTGIYYIDNGQPDIRLAIDRASFAKVALKDSYKSDYTVYEDEMGSSLMEDKKIENDMYRALKKREFKVYMQPKVDLQTGVLSGAEALVRWDHPELGLMGPDKFIPMFEKNGFIVNLDKYVFEEVCSNMSRWIKAGYDVVPVSVNVSRLHFLNSNFVSEYNKIKKKYRISDDLIEIEITESVVFSNNNEEVFTVMKEFRNEGFEISMDDFGSGYSSLGLLKEMPIDTLKLDKLFLNNIEEYSSQIIVGNIINMAKNLNLNVVSEGVETYMQVDFLRDIGCDMAQGFIFAKPEPMDEYEELIKKGKINYYKQYKDAI